MEQQWQSESINELVAAIVSAQVKMVPASKDHVNPYFKSKYADLPTCWEAVHTFREVGIAITQSPMEGPDGFILLDTQLSHTSGQWMRSRLKMRVAKDDPQGYGSAITYARRYALGCMTGLVTEEDDDGNAASQPQPQPRAVQFQQHKQTAQAKINELRNEGLKPEPQAAGQAEQGVTPQASDRAPAQNELYGKADKMTKMQWDALITAIDADTDLCDLKQIVKEKNGIETLMFTKTTPEKRQAFLAAFDQAADANGLASRVKALGL